MARTGEGNEEDAPKPFPATARIAPWSRFEEAALDAGVRRRLFSENRAMIVLCLVAADTFPPARVNDLDEITTVLEGMVEIRRGAVVVTLDPGQSIRIPAGTPHSVRACGARQAEVLNVFFPPASSPR
jgi:mannose-6-phosphate isomerase-like protein (cupin superfamily)